MPSRFSRTAILAGVILSLTACAERVPEPVVTAAPASIEAPLSKPKPVARAKRIDRCTVAKVDLPQDRKEALFRQFDAELGPVAAAGPAAVVASTPAPGPDCRQAAR